MFYMLCYSLLYIFTTLVLGWYTMLVGGLFCLGDVLCLVSSVYGSVYSFWLLREIRSRYDSQGICRNSVQQVSFYQYSMMLPRLRHPRTAIKCLTFACARWAVITAKNVHRQQLLLWHSVSWPALHDCCIHFLQSITLIMFSYSWIMGSEAPKPRRVV